eukprot:11200191-Lingulodinium_polyedra.AAC.1
MARRERRGAPAPRLPWQLPTLRLGGCRPGVRVDLRNGGHGKALKNDLACENHAGGVLTRWGL